MLEPRRKEPKRKVVIFGGSGFLGLNLARALSGNNDYDVCIISRHPPSIRGDWRHAHWDVQTLGAWVDELEGAAAVVNLVGRSVDCIKTPDHCDEILRSRVESTRLIGRALRKIKEPPPVWVQMSTAHIYGDPPEIVCTEESSLGYGLAPFVGKAWEEAYHSAVLPEMRRVILRTSFVLGRRGGALRRLELAARLGLGGTIGNGKQGISWLHEEDMNRLFLRAIGNETMQGVYIATAPNPISNAEFMRALRRALGAPIGLPSPAWMIRLAAPLILKTDPELALYGRYCTSTRLKEEGFEFNYPTIESALAAIYRRPSA
ncbi:MAG: TIGR01777 family oxidoreductase [Caldilinea sp.]|nr:TIGR01777 family oxidoreductase [Caldilinea sp.]MDW8440789.1 TIGR01777 family oxidoreductase [Caldilineaceae bacterium]